MPGRNGPNGRTKLGKSALSINLRRFYETFICSASPLLSRVRSLTIEGGARPSKPESLVIECFSGDLYKALEQSLSLVTLRVEKGAWGKDEDVKRIVEDVRSQGPPLRYLKEIIIVNTGLRQQNIFMQDKALLNVLDPDA